MNRFLARLFDNPVFRRWVSRAFIVSIAVYLIVIGILILEAVRGASKWEPYGVNLPVFISLIIASEIAITLTAVWVFKEDAGIWPPAVKDGWRRIRSGAVVTGARLVVVGAWDISIIDLRMRTKSAIFAGRVNRVAALAPLTYALAASAGRASWGLESSALLDIGITLIVWLLMETLMVRPVAKLGGHGGLEDD